MSKIRFIGDVHGYSFELGLILKNIPEDVTEVVQVGDLCVGFGQGNYWHDTLDNSLEKVNGRFIRGNHDNPAMCKTMKTWIPDGTVQNDMMFIGGAWSIDYRYRTMGYDLWEDEELSQADLNTVISIYDLCKPRIMVTHDCPHSAARRLFFDRNKSHYGLPQYKTRTSEALEEMFKTHQPALHIFGHWHQDKDEVINGTRFICLNELSYVDVDTNTLEVTWPRYQTVRGKP